MLSNAPQNLVVDERSTLTNIALTIPTIDHETGRANAVTHHIGPKHLLQSIGVKTADLIGTDVSIDVHPPQPTQSTDAHYGIMFHTGKDGDRLLNTPHRSVAVDAGTGDSSAYHYVHIPNAGFGKVNLPVREEPEAIAAHENDNMLAWKRSNRWLAEPPEGSLPFKLLTQHDVDKGVTKAELNGVTKYIVTPPSAVHRLITNSHSLQDPTTFLDGKYTPDNLKTTTVDGAVGFVVDSDHYDNAASTLKQSLDLNTAHPLGEGIHVTVEKLNDATNPTALTIPLTIHRTPRAAPNGTDTTAPVTVGDVEHALSRVTVGAPIAAASLEATAFDATAPGTKATLTPLVPIPEEN